MLRKIGFVLLGIFLFLVVLAGIVQSPWGTKKAQELLTNSLEKAGLHVQIEKVQGALPHEIDLTHVTVETDALILSIEKLRLRLSLLRLLKGELSLNDVFGEGISWEEKTQEPLRDVVREEAQKLPFLLNIRRFILKRVAVQWEMEGYLRVGKGSRYAFLDTRIQRSDLPDTSARLIASLSRNGNLQVRLELQTPHPEMLPQVQLPPGSLSAQLFAQGSWSAWMGGMGNLQGRVLGDFASPDWGNWAFSTRWKREDDRSWTLSRLQAKSSFLDVRGKAAFSAEKKLSSAQLSLESPEPLSVPPLRGRLFAKLDVERQDEAFALKASWQIPALEFYSYSALAVTGSGEGVWKEDTLQGKGAMQGELFSKIWKIGADFSWEKGASILFPSYKVEAPTLEATGDFAVSPEPFALIGTTHLHVGQLQELSLPDLFGSIDATVRWSASETLLQSLSVEGTGSNLYWKDLFSNAASFRADLLDPFAHPDGAISLDLEGVMWKTLFLETVSLQTAVGLENNPFRLFLDGTWKHPLMLDLEGSWRWQAPTFTTALQRAKGSFFAYPLTLASPVQFTYAPDVFRLSEFKLHVSDATLSAFIDRQKETTDARLSLKNFPIDFLSLNPLDVSVTGSIDLDASLQEKDHQIQGEFRASVEEMSVLTSEDPYPLDASGNFEGSYRGDQLAVKGELNVQETPLLHLDTSLPIHFELWPFQAEPLPEKEAKGRLTLNGRIEQILDFFDLGTHRLEGMCRCDLTLSNTLGKPIVKGTCDLEDGLYQNYYTGTQLQNLQAHLVAKDGALVLESLSAQDAEKRGSFSAKGKLSLNLSRKFPFQFDVLFSHLNCVQVNLITAEASGKVRIKGNLEQATAKGDVEILESHLIIPDKIPRTLPDLEVVYRNASKPMAPPAPPLNTRYPFFLDLDVHAPKSIFISGRGLNSTWGGDFHLGGTYASLATKGQIDLIKGEFLFSSRSFKLTDGSLFFTGVEKEMPYLNLSGATDAKGVTIIARLRGPLNNPQLTFQSTPPLPLSSILSLLLFGQDLSEINSFQALQLVNSLASIAGEGPDILEKGRKALGVDRLRIITVSSGDEEEGGETIAIQVGKYVAEGVIVTFSQGAEDNGSNVGVEVELKHGFSFQIETQQRQEQGKFTLKWSLNY